MRAFCVYHLIARKKEKIIGIGAFTELCARSFYVDVMIV